MFDKAINVASTIGFCALAGSLSYYIIEEVMMDNKKRKVNKKYDEVELKLYEAKIKEMIG